MKKAVVLLSGGLDSTTCLAIARSEGFDCYALSFAYGQRHHVELEAAARIARANSVVEHRVINLDLGQLGGSALTDHQLNIPDFAPSSVVPITYVPARNTIFLSIALGYAEVLEAGAIFIGANAIDYSNYPDCRPEFIESFQMVANVGTRAGLEGKGVRIHAPLLEMTKAEIIAKGLSLGVDYSLTLSCYQADQDGAACGRCDSCGFRRQGFIAAGVEDPTRYLMKR